MQQQPALRQIQTPTTKPQEVGDNLNRAIVVSIFAHVGVLLFFILRAVIYPSEPLRLENAIRVDMVALPDKMQKVPNVPAVETKVPPAPEPAKPEPVKPEPPSPPVAVKPELPKPPSPKAAVEAPKKPDSPKVNLDKAKRDQEAALKRLEALEKIERMSKTADATAAKPAARPPQPVKGNAISKGNSLTGVTRLEHQGYLEQVDGSVKGHWNLPGYLKNGKFGGTVKIFVDENGVVTKRQIVKSSGNEIFDNRALAAVDAANPLPKPPESLTGILSVDGMILEFGSD